MPGLRVWKCRDVLSRTFPLQPLSLCFMVFFMFCLFFENERSWSYDFYVFFVFVFFLLFIASDRAAFLHLHFSTVPHSFFFF